jgi:Nucleotidyl transferase AbiEii toxin, Type IV TA system
MTAPSRATIAGQAYLGLRRKARQDRRPADEPIQLYALEGLLARLAQTPLAKQFVLKGGMLPATLGEHRSTRDIDLQASTTAATPAPCSPRCGTHGPWEHKEIAYGITSLPEDLAGTPATWPATPASTGPSKTGSTYGTRLSAKISPASGPGTKRHPAARLRQPARADPPLAQAADHPPAKDASPGRGRSVPSCRSHHGTANGEVNQSRQPIRSSALRRRSHAEWMLPY